MIIVLFFFSVVPMKIFRLPFSFQPGCCALTYIAIGHTIKEYELLDKIYAIPSIFKIAILISWLPAIYLGGVSIGECNFMGKFLPLTFWGSLAGTYCFIWFFRSIGNRTISMSTYTLWIMLAHAILQFLVFYNNDYFHIEVSPLLELVILFSGSFILSFPMKMIIERIPTIKISK